MRDSRRLWAHRLANEQMLRDQGRGRAVVFLRAGGMRAIEEEAAATAVADARERWLPTLRDWHAKAKGAVRSLLAGEITRLRRTLGRPTPEELRAQTRERVRRFRAKRRSAPA
jgi:hypothetical protein